jgi:LEA14-like dessication related protein
MKKNYIVVGLIGLGLFLVGRKVLRKGEAIKNLNVNISKVDFNKKDRTFVVFLRVINPSNAPMQISSVVGDVIWRGTYGATLDYRIPVTIDPLGEKTLQIPVKMNLDFVNVILDLIANKSKALNGKFEVKGSINAEGLVFPFTYVNDIKLI